MPNVVLTYVLLENDCGIGGGESMGWAWEGYMMTTMSGNGNIETRNRDERERAILDT